MSLDPIESLAVIPNPTDNFDEVWMVVNRANGRFVERMTRRLKESDCGATRVLLDEQVFVDSALSYDEGQIITAVTIGTDLVYTITLANHGYSNGDRVRIRNVDGVPDIDNTSWVIGGVTTNTFRLITRI